MLPLTVSPRPPHVFFPQIMGRMYTYFMDFDLTPIVQSVMDGTYEKVTFDY